MDRVRIIYILPLLSQFTLLIYLFKEKSIYLHNNKSNLIYLIITFQIYIIDYYIELNQQTYIGAQRKTIL